MNGLIRGATEMADPGKGVGSLRVLPSFAEAIAGVLMMAGALMWLSIPLALFIGGIGVASVFKAVYIDKREMRLFRRRQQCAARLCIAHREPG